MSDWKFLNDHRVTSPTVNVPRRYVSDSSYGFNGMFRFVLDTHLLRCIASDGMGWQHVSVTEEGSPKPPSWSIMCKIKDLFFEPEDWVVQYHPAKSEYVNNHPGCMHLWRPTTQMLPVPESILVGIK